jgi:hypothetical protein
MTVCQPSSSLPAPGAWKYALRPSATTLNSYPTAREHAPRKSPAFLGRASSWSNTLDSGMPRSISLGSIDELRCNSFVATQQRVFSVPTVPSRGSSLKSSTWSTPRRGPRAVSLCDVDDLMNLSQLRTDPMFVDIQEGHQVDFVFPPSLDVNDNSVSPLKAASGSKSYSYRSLRQKDSLTPLLVRSSSIKSGLEEIRGKEKIPLFVPSHIIKPALDSDTIPERHSSWPSPDARLRVGDAAHDEKPNGPENHSKEALSDASDWSTTVQFESPKPEDFQAKSEASIAADPDLTVNQKPRKEERRSWEKQGDNGKQITLAGQDEIRSLGGRSNSAKYRAHRSSRVFEACYAYYQRVKQRLWSSSASNDDNS